MNQTGFVLMINEGNQYEPRVYESDKKKIGEDEKISSFVQKSSEVMLKIINENLTSDIFKDDWLELSEEEFQPPKFSTDHIKIFQSFTSLKYSIKKMISHISWYPIIDGIIVASCIKSYSFYERIDKFAYFTLQPSLILFWSFIDPINPKLLLEAPDDVLIFQFNPTNPNLVAGGCINGQLILWDLTSYQKELKKLTEPQHQIKSQICSIYEKEIQEVPIIKHVASSGIDQGHLSDILYLEWFPNNVEVKENGNVSWSKLKFSVQLMTSGSDGFIKIWDIRPEKKTHQDELFSVVKAHISIYTSLDLTWSPIHSVKLAPPADSAQNNVSVFSFEIKENSNDEIRKSAPPASNFIGGNVNGDIFYGDWKIPCDATGQLTECISPIYFECKIGGFVNTIQHSPFIQDVYLVVGGWKMAIWKSDIPYGPLLESSCGTCERTAGHWSLTRPGIIFIGQSNGNIEVWDILHQTHEPILIQNVSANFITKIKPKIMKDKSHVLAISDANGTLYIMDLPLSLWSPVQNEISLVKTYFEKESMRLRERQKMNLEKAEILRKEKESEVITKALIEQDKIPAEKEKMQTDEETLLVQQYDEYCKLETQSLMILGESSVFPTASSTHL
ncbi:WD repeat-containing protein 63-like [Centruroides sculpturatus]|uniref:WD repeat-containing protein 63-like n=1 Tax=Centruroides sculpturatus TaxID=218467 RepID=UPI000C6D4EF8|nr:WD repeat-containing protein 63-like [Centruroides sculpturatus]XP_023218216.1 WD repeat-containing protein 63-like [Centruroides sculpturatus]